ncbi:hypothetical protein EMIHUDRAFT_225639 [Emiliania huxleyi CCMP1516]|uniref:Uncharacterized protein n=2 Tax=Emiliania huxleyi TaxID=2903 RepID=A0A0D3KN90_EMIH1|nr:hypothetical protein EMIHUDRAFT_225639 [Emiliania huxleyi CCMP1516]EOD37225.1 hypothetical protein EMIHUDRAFT_225639 [Emiliania huxleyi CCMP1516]|eukprot:XP_005789654.1 hypothetical protein EMIHUDRAFT_225639 [Emiliania huxleyi CCMP1516]
MATPMLRADPSYPTLKKLNKKKSRSASRHFLGLLLAMGACFSCETDGSERQVILLSLDDGSVVRARKSRLSLFADLANVRPDAIPTFAIDVKEKAGPLCVFGTKASPEGLKPLKPKDASAVDKALCKHDLFHGGEQGLFAAHATLDAKPCLLALTSLGRLFAVAGGAAFRTLHARLDEASPGLLRLGLSSGEPPWQVATSPRAAAELQLQVWVAHSLAAGRIELQTGLPVPPLELLPPVCEVDGNLHAAWTMHANALGQVEVEEVLSPVDEAAGVTTALQCVREWAATGEVDASRLRPSAVRPLARALAHNGAFVAFKVSGNALGAEAAALAPLLGSSRTLIGALGDALAGNRFASLSVIDLSDNAVGDAAFRLAAGLRSLRAGLLAELKLVRCGVGPEGMEMVLLAAGTQKNLLELRLGGNTLGGRGSQALGTLLPQAPSLTALDLAGTALEPAAAFGPAAASVDPFSARPEPRALQKLAELDLSGIGWSLPLLDGVEACGPKLAALSLAGGGDFAMLNSAAADRPPRRLVAVAAARPGMELDLSTADPAAVLLPELLPALRSSRLLPPSLALRGDGQLGDDGLVALVGVLVGAKESGTPRLHSLTLSSAVPPPAAAVSTWGLDDLNALALLDQLATDPAGVSAVVSRWQLALPAGTERAVAQRAASVRSLMRLVTTADGLAALKCGGGYRSLEPDGTCPAADGRSSTRQRAAPSYGVQLESLFRFALPKSSSLTLLDVSGNNLGDVGLSALGGALKLNRSLRRLEIDNNAAGVDGLKSINLALKGNKKVHSLALPDDDISALLAAAAARYKRSLSDELAARQLLKSAYGRGGYCNHAVKQRGMAALKSAKQEQARARVAKDKLRTVCASLQASVLRNGEVATITAAGKNMRAESKLASEASKSAAKAQGKADALREANKEKVWLGRHKLLDAWVKHAGVLGKRGHDVGWFGEWRRAWGKPYLNPAALAAVQKRMPAAQREEWEALVLGAEDTFASEETLDARVQGLLQEARMHRSQAEFHAAEVQYHGMLSEKDPRAEAPPRLEAGIAAVAKAVAKAAAVPEVSMGTPVYTATAVEEDAATAKSAAAFATAAEPLPYPAPFSRPATPAMLVKGSVYEASAAGRGVGPGSQLQKQYTYARGDRKYYLDQQQSGFGGLGGYHHYQTYRRDTALMAHRPYHYRHYAHSYYYHDPFFWGLPYYGYPGFYCYGWNHHHCGYYGGWERRGEALFS